MALHRYWRAINIQSYSGAALEITAFHLLSDTLRVDAPAALTTSIAPTTGVVSTLQDDDLATGVTWASSKGLGLQWDFGVAPVDVTDIRLGSADDSKAFPLVVVLQWSNDSVSWVTLLALPGIAWPGARTKTVSDALGYWGFDGSAGSYQRTSSDRRSCAVVLYNALAEKSANTGVRQFEVTAGAAGASWIGVSQGPITTGAAYNDPTCWLISSSVKANGVGGVAYPGSSVVTNSQVGVVVDFTAGTITFYIDGVSKGIAYSNLAGLTLFPTLGGQGSEQGPVYRLYTQNFLYPVAGATPWEPGLLIRRRSVRGGSSVIPRFKLPTMGATPDFSGVILNPALKQDKDYTDGSAGWGTGRITGTVKETGTPNTPVFKRVRLHRMVDGMLVREQWSDKVTGAYSFNNIDPAYKFYVVSHDHLTNYNAVIKDNLTPEPMP